MSKPRTDAQKDRAKDKRLQSKYGITLARQDEIRREQNNRCKICRVEFTADNPACTDHFHYRIAAQKLGSKSWQVSGCNESVLSAMVVYSATKADGVRAMKVLMAPKSVRGLLCRKCNRGLGYIERFFDAARHPENITPIHEYLKSRLTSN